MESSTKPSKHDNMAFEGVGMPDKSHDMYTKRKDMEKLCPETTFARNLTSFTGKKALITLIIILLSLVSVVSVTVNIWQHTWRNLPCECFPPNQTNDGTAAAADDNKITTFLAGCDSSPCLNSGACEESIECVCRPGYIGDFCETDFNECASDPCQNGGTCLDDIDRFVCICKPGFQGSVCDIDINECASAPCLHGGTCIDGPNFFECNCVSGYEGIYCQTDIDECLSAPCSNGATCLDSIDKFLCICVDGFEGDLCETNIDECASNPCQNGGTCTDAINSFSCRCLNGYYGTMCEDAGYLVLRDELSNLRFSCDVVDSPASDTIEACAVYAANEPRANVANFDDTIDQCELQLCGSDIKLSYTNNANFLLMSVDDYPPVCVSRTAVVEEKPTGYKVDCIPLQITNQPSLDACKASVCAVDWDAADYDVTSQDCVRKECGTTIEWIDVSETWTSIVVLKPAGTVPITT